MTDSSSDVLKRIITLKTNQAIYLALAERAALLATTVAEPHSPEEDGYLTEAEFYRLAAELTGLSARELVEPITTALKEGKHD